MEERLGCLCISTGPSDTSNHAITNYLAIEQIFLFFHVSAYGCQNGLPAGKAMTSVLFWEYLVKSLGMATMAQPAGNRGSEDGLTSGQTTEIPVTDLNPAAVWIPDSEVSECQTCLKTFSFLVRKHHCRLCGRVVCGECSKHRMVLEKTNKPVRVCRSCYYGHMNDGM